ncbi:MAG TPA: tyrosine-type recombinase/integrase [Oligoflexus sp.]|uniref:tyrosine-type recombinase/integrase n=1 Tax=Oligoflexus sp. TaxID=1971216 RepID=UPI002D2AE0DC|nr:tyrosine-type recombinase/integrase [Oligoflexus sp.]HYX36942.1 tyrosine-type recombinase/integrase [Oligoflexus sp.]
MSIHKTKCKTYEVKWRENGKLRSHNFKRKIDAEKFQASLKLGKRQFLFAEEKEKKESELTFMELAEVWVRDHAEVHKAPSTVIRDKQIIRDYLLPFIGSMKLSDVSKRSIIDIQANLHRGGKLKPKTINNIIGLCHKIFSDAVGWGMAPANPLSYIKPIKCPESEFRFWTFTERDRFLTFVRSRNPRVYDVVTFAVHTGLRRGEVEGLQRDCIDFERREIIVKRNFCHKTNKLNDYTKGKKFRRVPMNDTVHDMLKKYMLLRPSETVFDLDFQHLVSRYLLPLQQEAGVSQITFHDLRHSFASHLAMSGVSVFDIQKLLGHTDIKTTMRYMHLAPDHLRGVTDVLVKKSLSEKLEKTG